MRWASDAVSGKEVLRVVDGRHRTRRSFARHRGQDGPLGTVVGFGEVSMMGLGVPVGGEKVGRLGVVGIPRDVAVCRRVRRRGASGGGHEVGKGVVEVGDEAVELGWDGERWDEKMQGGVYSARKPVCGVCGTRNVTGVGCAACLSQGGVYALECIVCRFVPATAVSPALDDALVVSGYLEMNVGGAGVEESADEQFETDSFCPANVPAPTTPSWAEGPCPPAAADGYANSEGRACI
jgi:hypothetical protein